MFRSLDITSSLRSDILDLKKEVSALKNENHLFKVKIRKLQNEINKKDKQIETLINPEQSFFIKRIVSEKGATMIITLKDRIKKLEKAINEKDGIIKRLQNDLQTKKLYTLKSADKKKTVGVNPSKHHTSIPFFEIDFEDELRIFKSASLDDIPNELTKKTDSRRRSTSADPVKHHKKTLSINHDVKAQYEGLPRSRLLSIIENLKNNQHRLSPVRRRSESPDSDIERCELQCETPHPEVQQLQNYFMDILDEVDHLKVTISTLKNEQEKTTDILKEKNLSIEHLDKEIEILRKPSSRSKIGLTNKRCSRTQHLCLREIRQQSMCSQTSKNCDQSLEEEQNGSNIDKLIL
ncbi:hypothetical protein RN001_012577 [Aquatica leii]|uniref:Uncharacterized protein n=1 Tax=Aquatica leii TaxID=1421715 RepID=A0AAN7Q1R8_9COLE|nr:hypothetical protein RN001_012577 [Aquatica leii]